MALSDEEQRLLEQLEASLAKDDPKLAHTLRGTRQRPAVNTKAGVAGAAGFLVGISMLVAGIQTHWVVSVIGFVVMLGSAIFALGAWKTGEPAPDHHRRPSISTSASSGAPSTPFMDKLEERWRRRQDEGY